MKELVYFTASQLAELIRGREVSATEVLEAHMRHIELHNPKINSIVTLDAEAARRRAEEADAALARGEVWGPLHGVPVTIKDTFETAGLRTTSSFRRLANHVPTRDATAVSRMRRAGAIILGKTNMPELAMDGQTNSPLFGRTNNPWDLSRTPSGSTGGGAAAVAAGLSPLEIGSDIGGSLRTPAHSCGVYAIKPTDLMVSPAGHIPGAPWRSRGVMRGLLSVGPLARSVADLRLALSVIAGPDERAWDIPPVSLEIPPVRSIGELRIAWTDGFGGVPVSADTQETVSGLAEKLKAAGAQVEYCSPSNLDFREAQQTSVELMATVFSLRPASVKVPRLAWKLAEMAVHNPIARGYLRGSGASLRDYARTISRQDSMIESMEAFLSNWDAWLCPVAPIPAFHHMKTNGILGQARAAIDVDGTPVPYTLITSGYTNTFNLTGNPVVVIPASRSREGLPIGVQIVGRRWSDMALLGVAEQVDAVAGGFQRPPGF